METRKAGARVSRLVLNKGFFPPEEQQPGEQVAPPARFLAENRD
ncbi:hypothetical protein [Methanosarcina sp. MSH10X1]|nr:hypothetical protein [Methanosarcina sp. MSH10X1]